MKKFVSTRYSLLLSSFLFRALATTLFSSPLEAVFLFDGGVPGNPKGFRSPPLGDGVLTVTPRRSDPMRPFIVWEECDISSGVDFDRSAPEDSFFTGDEGST